MLFVQLGCHAFLVVGTAVQHLRKDLELGADFRALELGCRTGVPSEIGTPVPTMACDLKKHPNRYRYVQVHALAWRACLVADRPDCAEVLVGGLVVWLFGCCGVRLPVC